MPILNFLPLLIWMLVFFALNQRGGENVTPVNVHAAYRAWLLGSVIFLGIGIWITARA